MQVSVEDTCTACGLCCETCPEVFDLGDVIAEVLVDEVPLECEPAAHEAAEECPVMAIVIIE